MKPMKTIAWMALALLGAVPAMAVPPKPKLIVAISVDQFSGDLFAEYRGSFTGGLRRLTQGVVYPQGYQSHAATETCPGHSTILTGSHPAHTGIIANNWFDQSLARADKRLYCSEDPTAPGSTSDKYVVSTQLLKVPTLGDRLKAADPTSRVVSVAGKDRAAVMLGGHATDQIWFWDGQSFSTLVGRRNSPQPTAVADVNRRAAAEIARPTAVRLPASCSAHASPLPVGGGQVGMLEARKPGDARRFRASSMLDTLTADLALAFLDEMKLGRGPATDVLAIGLSATDYVGHGFGTEGAEMCAQMAALDATLGRIFKALDKSGVSYAVVLTADHGGHDLPERNMQRGMPLAKRVDPALSPAALGKQLAAEFGLKGDVLLTDGPFGDFYVARDVPQELRPRLIAAAKAHLLAEPQVAAVMTADELRRMPIPLPPVDEWSLAERARASFDPERSGDLIVLLKPQVTPIADPGRGYVATHGSPWNYDRRVPILFWWPGVQGFEQPLPVGTVDILPTLAALVGLKLPPAEIDGRCLDLDPGSATSCPVGSAD